MSARPPLIVLDDDPTGTQSLTAARVVCELDEDLILAAVPDIRSLHLLTNSRALDPEEARRVTFEAASAATSAVPEALLILRGDSTLRAHLVEEYRGYIDAVAGGEDLPLVLVPALPAAGRVTVGGRQVVVVAGRSIPVEETAYARDPDFGYSTGRLLDWAEERSDGLFSAARGSEVSLERLRGEGPQSVIDAVEEAGRRLPAAVAIDAEAEADLKLVAAGIHGASAACVRCAPALVGALAGNTARELVRVEPSDGGVLVVCGSWVPLASAQLRELERAHPACLVEVDAAELVRGSGQAEIDRASAACRARIAEQGIAVISTPRELDRDLTEPALRQRLATRLALAAREVAGAAGSVVAKGGITSALTARVTLAATRADVIGPIAPGVALWVPLDGPSPGTPLAVVPGNVGDEHLLVEVVAKLTGASAGAPSRAGAVH